MVKLLVDYLDLKIHRTFFQNRLEVRTTCGPVGTCCHTLLGLVSAFRRIVCDAKRQTGVVQ